MLVTTSAGSCCTLVGSVPVAAPEFPPPDTETVLVTDGWTLFATATVSVTGG